MILLVSLALLGCSNNEPSSYVTPDNTPIKIDIDSIEKISNPGCIPVRTTSIKENLLATGRFEITEFSKPFGDVDVHFSLDNRKDNAAASVFFTEIDETTTIISFNFSKKDINGDISASIRWGLDALLQTLGDCLNDDIWDDLLTIAAKSEDVGAFGTDFEGYSNQDTGLKLIYADLGNNVQVDIRPYN